MTKLILAFCLCLGLLKADSPTKVVKQQKVAEKLLKQWKQNFKMDKVNITIEVGDMTKTKGALGLTDFNCVGHDACIYVLRQQDYPKFSSYAKVKKDQKNTVIHELLHVVTSGYSEESAIQRIADVFAEVK